MGDCAEMLVRQAGSWLLQKAVNQTFSQVLELQPREEHCREERVSSLDTLREGPHPALLRKLFCPIRGSFLFKTAFFL